MSDHKPPDQTGMTLLAIIPTNSPALQEYLKRSARVLMSDFQRLLSNLRKQASPEYALNATAAAMMAKSRCHHALHRGRATSL